MPLFRYRAIGEDGKTLRGIIDADSMIQAKEKLRKGKLIITDLISAEKKSEIVLPSQLLIAFTRELGQLLRAGLPLYESLLTFEEKYRRHRAHPLFADLCDRLKNGSLLSAALRHYPKSFDEIYISMIAGAEKSGSLATVFAQIELLLGRQQKLKKQLFSALAYPTFLALFCFGVVCTLFFFVIPSMRELFTDRRLHPVTETVLAISAWANGNIPLLIALLGSFIAGLLYLTRTVRGKMTLSQIAFKTPFFRDFLLHSALIRFSRSLSLLMNAGVPLLSALSLSRKVMANDLLASAVERGEKRIAEGQLLSSQLKESGLFPSQMVRMLAFAEEIGKMAPMLENIAEIYEEELEKNISLLTTFLQPAVLLVLGAIVGVVILSILLPLTDVSSFL